MRRNFSLVAHYSLKFTHCLLLVVKSLVTRCKLRLLLVAEVACCRNSLVTCCEIRSLLVAKKSLVTNYKVARCKRLVKYSYGRQNLNESESIECFI